jgi:2-oxoglutarate dehydrogenase E2 component (dihydrolipoamide succinyltransferase)
MSVNIVVPELGESVLEATVGEWLKQEGESVEAGEALVELETDKVNLEVSAPQSGVLAKIERRSQEDVHVGDVLGTIEPSAAGEGSSRPPQPAREQAPTPQAEPAPVAQPAPELTPVARRFAEEQGIDTSQVKGSGPGGRVTRTDLVAFTARTQDASSPGDHQPSAPTSPEQKPEPPSQPSITQSSLRGEERIKMSRRRRTIASRLVEAQQTAAILSTFNEVDMSAVMDLRKRRGEDFQKRTGVKLGFMSFFVKASLGALKVYPQINAEIQAD